MTRVVFFNHYHNGDVHASRGFVRHIIERVPNVEFFYSHRNSECLLFDVPGLRFDRAAIDNVKDSDGVIIAGDTTYINTWYGRENHKYLKQYGIMFDSLYAAFDDTCKQLWGFGLGGVEDVFPTIDYEKFEIGGVKKWLENHKGKLVLIDNGKVLSNQSVNFPFDGIVKTLAHKHTDTTFILTQKENTLLPPNVFYSRDIVGIADCDLNEISFLSSFCGVVVGRASGVFTFSLTKKNLFDRNMKFLCFSNLVPTSGKVWIGSLLNSRVDYSAKTINMNVYNVGRVLSVIDSELNEV